MAALHTLLQWSTANTPAPTSSSNPSTSHSAAPFDPSRPTSSLDQPSITASAAHDSEIATSAKRTDINTAMLDHIMGKSDAVIMREKMEVMRNEEEGMENRMVAMDDYEMLIESLDNANDIQSLQHWPLLLSLLKDPEDDIIRGALWICGTAVQNNWKAQESFLAQDPLPTVLSLISSVHPTTSTTAISSSTRSKAVYCLSSALKHWPSTSHLLSASSSHGWKVLRDGLKDSEISVRRKVAFMIGGLILQSDDVWIRNGEKGEKAPEPQQPRSTTTTTGRENENEIVQAMKENGIIDTLIKSISNPLPTGPDGEIQEQDWDYNEKCFRALVAASERKGLSEGQKKEVKEVMGKWEKEDIGLVGFSKEEWKDAEGKMV